MKNLLRNILVSGMVGLEALGCNPSSEETAKSNVEYTQPQTPPQTTQIDSSYANIDTLALHERLYQDYEATGLIQYLLSLEAKNDPRAPASSESLQPYLSVSQAIWGRIDARIDSLIKARAAMQRRNKNADKTRTD